MRKYLEYLKNPHVGYGVIIFVLLAITLTVIGNKNVAYYTMKDHYEWKNLQLESTLQEQKRVYLAESNIILADNYQKNITISKLIERLDTLEYKVAKLNNYEVAKRLIYKLKPGLSKDKIQELAFAVAKYCEEFKMPPQLIISIIKWESNFDSNLGGPTVTLTSGVTSSCLGYMQIEPNSHTAKYKRAGVASHRDILDVNKNIKLGTWIIDERYRVNHKNIRAALQDYVGGPNPKYVGDVMTLFAELVIETYKM